MPLPSPERSAWEAPEEPTEDEGPRVRSIKDGGGTDHSVFLPRKVSTGPIDNQETTPLSVCSRRGGSLMEFISEFGSEIVSAIVGAIFGATITLKVKKSSEKSTVTQKGIRAKGNVAGRDIREG